VRGEEAPLGARRPHFEHVEEQHLVADAPLAQHLRHPRRRVVVEEVVGAGVRVRPPLLLQVVPRVKVGGPPYLGRRRVGALGALYDGVARVRAPAPHLGPFDRRSEHRLGRADRGPWPRGLGLAQEVRQLLTLSHGGEVYLLLCARLGRRRALRLLLLDCGAPAREQAVAPRGAHELADAQLALLLGFAVADVFDDCCPVVADLCDLADAGRRDG
jgi:hypothetical protein